ncbi:MAG TPA: ADP-ribosyltransferase, partial [Pseudonocardia sp.]|nr:ADP-ribosyltransferase [Pseudonocardia sp.]
GMQQAAGACGRDVASRIERYNQVLNDCVRLTSDLSVVGRSGGAPTGVGDPAQAGGLPLGALSARFEGSTAAPAFPTPGFAPAPRGPLAEVTPLPPLLPDLPGFVPAPGGPSIVITPPAPDLGLGSTDQGQLGSGTAPPGLHVDADTQGVQAGVPLSPEDQDKLDKWIGPGFRTINPALRGQTPLTPEIQADADDVSSVLAKLPPTPGTVYRGTTLSDDELARYQPGERVIEPGFTASSLDPTRAFGGNVTFTIDSVNGKYVAPYAGTFAGQQEVLFDKNSQFEVLSRDVDPQTGKTEIELSEVPR